MESETKTIKIKDDLTLEEETTMAGLSSAKMTEMRRYLREIGTYGNLTQEETSKLFSEMREGGAGSQAARGRLIKHNLRLAAAVAKSHIGCGVPFDDLVSAGNLGLIEAVDRYDAEKGNALTTYATYWIEMEIREAIERALNPIYRPKHLIAAVNAVSACSKALEQMLGRIPTCEEIAECFGGEMSADDIRTIQAQSRINQMSSMDKRLDESDSDSVCVGDMIADESVSSPSESMDRKDARDILREAVGRLPELYKRIINLRFAIGDGAPADGEAKTLDEVAQILHDEGVAKKVFSKEYIRQLEESALGALKKDPKVQALGGLM